MLSRCNVGCLVACGVVSLSLLGVCPQLCVLSRRNVRCLVACGVVSLSLLGQDRRINDQRYQMDASKLKSLGWAPTVPWESGFADTVEWYKAHQDYWPEVDDALAAHPTKHPGPATWTCTILPSALPTLPPPSSLSQLVVAAGVGALLSWALLAKARGS